VKRIIPLILALAVLGGCATTSSPTALVPVAVACKTEDPAQPSYRFSPPYDDIFIAVRDLMGDRELAMAYEVELRAALKSCK
jgi:hypothetical protein